MGGQTAMILDIALGILLGGILLMVSGGVAVFIYVAIIFFLDAREIRKTHGQSRTNIRRRAK